MTTSTRRLASTSNALSISSGLLASEETILTPKARAAASSSCAELGASAKMNGAFSLNQFTTNWSKLSPQAKSALFSNAHRKWLDDIANLGVYLKDADLGMRYG
jgi:hypothetical protein